MATVDVIIPAYNTARYLPFALESVGQQQFQDWQILLVDDGSTDNTPDIVAPFRERFGQKLTYIRQANAGLPAARNVGIRSSNSEFIALLDADDIWLPNRLADTLKVFGNRPEVGLTYGGVILIDEEGLELRTYKDPPPPSRQRVASRIYTREINLPCPTMTFRRKCVEEVGLFDETMRATEDRDLWLRIAQRYEVAFVPAVLARYRRSAGSMSADPQRMFHSQMVFIDKHYGTRSCGFVQRQFARSISWRQRAEGLRFRGEIGKALHSSLRAIAAYPLNPGNYKTMGSLLLQAMRPGHKRTPTY